MIMASSGSIIAGVHSRSWVERGEMLLNVMGVERSMTTIQTGTSHRAGS